MDKFPSTSQASSPGYSESSGRWSNSYLTPPHLETSSPSFSSGIFGSNLSTRPRNVPVHCDVLEDEVLAVLARIQLQEDGSSAFRFPLASIDDVSLTNANGVTHQHVNQDKSWNRSPYLPLPHGRVPAEPFLAIFCCNSYNLVKTMVNFSIQVCDVPREITINANMFEALVVTPDGRMVPCFVGDASPMFCGFTGSFWAVDEGCYKVLVRMFIPQSIWSLTRYTLKDGGQVVGSLDIPVSRCYSEDCRTEALVIRCRRDNMTRRGIGGVLPQWSPVYTVAQQTTRRGGFQSKMRSKLWGLTTNLRTNNLFYTDRDAHEVTCIHPGGQPLFKFGQEGPLNTRLYRPAGIAYDMEHGRLLIADKDNHRICFFSLDGQYISSFGGNGHGNGLLSFPWDVAVSPDGQRIVVSDSRNKRIQLFDRFGNFLGKYSVFERNPFVYKNEFNYPRGITFNETGNFIYVTDFNLDNVMRIPLDLSHHHRMIPEGQLRRPQGITVDWAGNLLVADTRNNSIRHVSPRSDLISSITHVLRQPLHSPVNVTTMAGGYVAVLDQSQKIYIF